MEQEYHFTDFSESILRNGSIIDKEESPINMVTRITEGLRNIDDFFLKDHKNTSIHIKNMERYICTKMVVPNTTIMTNLGRHNEKPLSACTVPDLDMKDDLEKIKAKVDDIHLSGMGTGFDFSGLSDPIKILKYLNDAGVSLEESGEQERPVGNMGIISVYDSHIMEFINVKRGADKRGEKWNFNISISIDDNFIDSVNKNENITLSDGKNINANEIFNLIAESTHECADPGILFMDKMQSGNTTPDVGKYVSVAPCGETGLAKGETCNFSSINIAKFVNSNNKIDYNELEKVIIDLVRYLDNIVEYNLDKYSDESSKDIMKKKRKIGIGICGVADMFLNLKIPYGSKESIELSEDIMSFINFKSKEASMNLAMKRGVFGAFNTSLYQTNYISKTFGKKNTNTVLIKDWEKLEKKIKKNGLRNSNTVILPPTGRSALIFGASQQIEPIFSLKGLDGELPISLINEGLNSNILSEIKQSGTLDVLIQSTNNVYKKIIEIYKTANELSLKNHLDILEAFSNFTDEAVSKTVNLPNNASIQDIKDIYLDCHRRGLKGVTIYRDGSKEFQPIKTSK